MTLELNKTQLFILRDLLNEEVRYLTSIVLNCASDEAAELGDSLENTKDILNKVNKQL